MKRIELAIAAGLMEGEGTIRIARPRKYTKGTLCVSVTNTDKEIIDWMNHRWPGYVKPLSVSGANRKPAWMWLICARRARAFLRAIKPFIVTTRMAERIDAAEWWQTLKAIKPHLKKDADFQREFECWL